MDAMQSIRKLGFRTEDVRLILNSHAHYDHAGGIAALQRASGATVAASASGARAIEKGGAAPEDPQYGFGREANSYPAVARVKVVADGETPVYPEDAPKDASGKPTIRP